MTNYFQMKNSPYPLLTEGLKTVTLSLSVTTVKLHFKGDQTLDFIIKSSKKCACFNRSYQDHYISTKHAHYVMQYFVSLWLFLFCKGK